MELSEGIKTTSESEELVNGIIDISAVPENYRPAVQRLMDIRETNSRFIFLEGNNSGAVTNYQCSSNVGSLSYPFINDSLNNQLEKCLILVHNQRQFTVKFLLDLYKKNPNVGFYLFLDPVIHIKNSYIAVSYVFQNTVNNSKIMIQNYYRLGNNPSNFIEGSDRYTHKDTSKYHCYSNYRLKSTIIYGNNNAKIALDDFTNKGFSFGNSQLDDMNTILCLSPDEMLDIPPKQIDRFPIMKTLKPTIYYSNPFHFEENYLKLKDTLSLKPIASEERWMIFHKVYIDQIEPTLSKLNLNLRQNDIPEALKCNKLLIEYLAGNLSLRKNNVKSLDGYYKLGDTL